MKKFFQVFVDFDDEKELVPMRIDPERIVCFRKWTSKTTMVWIESSNESVPNEIVVNEEYEKFASRLFAFVNLDEIVQSQSPTILPKKKVVVKRKVHTTEEESFYDHNQPETNY